MTEYWRQPHCLNGAVGLGDNQLLLWGNAEPIVARSSDFFFKKIFIIIKCGLKFKVNKPRNQSKYSCWSPIYLWFWPYDKIFYCPLVVVFFNSSFKYRGMRWQHISVFGTFVWGAWSCWVGKLPTSNIHANASLYWHKQPKWKSLLQWGWVMQTLKINIHEHWYLCDNQ